MSKLPNYQQIVENWWNTSNTKDLAELVSALNYAAFQVPEHGMTPSVAHALANECYHAALGKEQTSQADVERILRRCGVVVTNLAALEEMRSK